MRCFLFYSVYSSFVTPCSLHFAAWRVVVCVTAFGCEPLVAPSGVWMRLSSDLQSSDNDEWSPVATMTAVFRCNDSDEAWHLLCHGTRWIGHVGNCTATSTSGVFWSKSLTGEHFPRVKWVQLYPFAQWMQCIWKN